MLACLSFLPFPPGFVTLVFFFLLMFPVALRKRGFVLLMMVNCFYECVLSLYFEFLLVLFLPLLSLSFCFDVFTAPS